MKISISFFALVAAGLDCVVSLRRIFNGQDAAKNEFPFVVSVRSGSNTCGGTLLNELFVLTAAHCLMDVVKGQKITVVLGAKFYYSYKKESGKIELRDRMKFWIHENFTMPSAENDIAVIQLPKAVTFSKSIRPVKVLKHFSDAENKECEEVTAVVSGWGAMDDFLEPAEVLQTASLKLLSFKECIKFQPHFIEHVTKNHICAIGQRYKNMQPTPGICNGDSGGFKLLRELKQ